MRTLLTTALLSLGLLTTTTTNSASAERAFRAGAFSVNINPTRFPVRVNAMFTERSADKVVDPLYAKALALDDGGSRMVFCVVDTCMIPRSLIDTAKAEAARATGLPIDRMLICSTHTHSAPSAMGCLGSRLDPDYAASLPPRIAAAITGAIERLVPARVGWAQMDDWEHTFNRRWIRRPDKMIDDPFGNRNVRAHMHPGHESPDAVGPSGPVDPQLSVLALQRLDGKPLALLANYSMHYYESALLSSDYFGKFAGHVGTMLGADDSFVGIMTQGTSGDLMWMDYGSPRHEIGYDAYAREIALHVASMVKGLSWKRTAPLRMSETKLKLDYRAPDEQRLKWARAKAAEIGDRLPKVLPEIYALEAIELHNNPHTELVLQAVGIGSLGIATLPNEVYAITGLKIKARSPFQQTFNIELANGAEGYIPPPEQHKLGGYTTWPARTAGLETNAEPRIVDTALSLLHQVSAGSPQQAKTTLGRYSRAVLSDRPIAYYRFEEIVIPTAHDLTRTHDAQIEDGVALFLPGADDRVGFKQPRPSVPNAFSGPGINRSLHFAGGRVSTQVSLPDSYSVEFWFWNGLATNAREITGHLFSRGSKLDPQARGEHLGLSGDPTGATGGKLFLSTHADPGANRLMGHTTIPLRTWNHAVLVRQGSRVQVFLNGQTEPELEGVLPHAVPAGESSIYLGGRTDGRFGWEGKIDEVALYPRPLRVSQIVRHYKLANISTPNANAR